MSVKITDLVKPFNSGFTAISTKLIIEDLTKRYAAFVEPNIKVVCFKEKKDYFIYASLPSKANDKYKDDKIYYDIVIQLIAPNGAMERNDTFIRHWDVKVYNNNPSFLFTFNYVYNSKHALVNMPWGYYSKPGMRIKPKTRNPLMLMGIDENLWFTVMYMDKNHMFDRATLEGMCQGNDLNYKWMVKQIVPQDEKLREVQDRAVRQRNNKKREQELERLTKNEKERQKEKDKEETRQKDHALSGGLGTETLRTTSFNDLSSNLNASNSSALAKKNTMNKTRLKSGLKSSL